MSPTRRDFLAATASAGFVLGFDWSNVFAAPAQDGGASGGFEPSAFLRVASDDTITLWVTQLEMGQGVRTVLPMILADELEADWSRVRIEQAWPGGKFKGIRLHTAGSSSTSDWFQQLRLAGATAREMLVCAAASAWSVAPTECRAESGTVVHASSGRRRSYGSLAALAARIPPPPQPALKDPATFRYIGKPMKRVDGPAIVTGRAGFGIDVRVPGMLFATIERARAMGSTVLRFDGSAALKIPGVRHVVPVTRGIHPGVAVVADDNWAALRGRQALQIEWSPGLAADFDSERYLAELPQALERPIFDSRHEGDADAALASAARRHDATYIFPFQAHATMEPMNCTADVRADRAEIWAPTQTDVRTLQQVAKVTGLPEDAIALHCTLMGGGFGRRLFADYAAEAAEISKTIGAPVQVTWTREDDMTRGYYQPATGERFIAGLDDSGNVTALVHHSSLSDLTIYDMHNGRNIWTNTPPKRPRSDAGQLEHDGAFDTPYEFANLLVDCADVTSPIPVGPWRAVEYPSTIFARESFLDELAHLAAKDPIAFRLALLPRDIKSVGDYKIERARLARVLEEVRRRSKWNEAPESLTGRRRGRGVAANVYHASSYIAMVADVSVSEDLSDIRVHQITTVVDCGLVLNPLGVLGQTESGITWGLSAALFGKMDFKAGAAVQKTYTDFQVLRIDRMPALDTVVLAGDGMPSGFGEHPVPLVAPAVANAIFAATGRRLRSLPLNLKTA